MAGGKRRHTRWYHPKEQSRLAKYRKKQRRERRERDAQMTMEYGERGHRSCGKKRRYETEEEATRYAYKCMSHPGVPLLRVYRCSLCGGWHLTSAPNAFGADD